MVAESTSRSEEGRSEGCASPTIQQQCVPNAYISPRMEHLIVMHHEHSIRTLACTRNDYLHFVGAKTARMSDDLGLCCITEQIP